MKATTKTSVGITLYKKNTADGCVLTQAKMTIDITLKLPNWVDKASATVQDQKMFDLFLKFIKRHERGHININLKIARELQEELAQLNSMPSCQELGNKIKTLTHEAAQKQKEDNSNYDKRTDDGHTQHPDFPFTCNWSEINI